MAAVDFPNSPTVGDIYTTGDISRKWDGTTWSVIATTITGPTGATGPQILSATSPILWDSGTRILSFAGLNSILPTQTSNANKFLQTNGSTTSWADAAVSITNDTSTATTLYPLFTSSTSGTITAASVTSSKLKYTPSTGLLETSAITTTGALIVGGDLTVNGTTTTINATTLTVDDKNIELGSVAVPSDVTAQLGGITLKGASDKTFQWTSTGSNWASSENLDLVTTKVYKINNVEILSATKVLGITPTINATGFTLSGGTTAVAVTFAGGAAYTISGTNAQTYTMPTAGGTLITGSSPTITTPQLQLETTARTTEGSAYWDSTYDILKIGDGTAAVSIHPFDINATAKTAAYTLTTTDYNTLVQMNGAFAFTINTSLSAAPVGTQITLLALTAGVSVTVTGITVYSTPGLKLRAQYSAATLICLASNVWLLTGDLSA